jgi:hypothetical protein
VKATVTLNDAQWHRFRVECLERKLSASEMLDRLIKRQLDEWKKENGK